MYAESGNLEKAWQQLEICQRLAPRQSEIFSEKAEIQIRKGNFKEALALYEKAVSLKPQSIESTNRLNELREYLQRNK